MAHRTPSSAPDALAALGRLPGVAEAQEQARSACTELRWHEALRRRSPEAAAESRVRGAQASAELEGARSELSLVRDRMRGATAWSTEPDPVESVVRGAVLATAETERLTRLVSTAPLQALARLHAAAAASLLPPDQRGRPRRDDEVCRELTVLGPPPPAAEVAARLQGVADLVSAVSGGTLVSALVGCAVVHAELAMVRPFVSGNGIVARAIERCLMASSGLDPTGVAVVEAGHRAGGGTAYRGALAAYASGSQRGVGLWVVHCGEAVAAGAAAGRAVADAVLAGRLS